MGVAIAKVEASQLPIVKALVETQPDALLGALCERFTQKTGVTVNATMQRAG